MHGSSLNHTYRLVWSTCTNTYVAVAENTRGRGKGGRAGRVAAVVLAGFALINGALAAPPGGDAASGAVLTGTNTVNAAATPNTVIDGNSGTGYFVQSGNLTINNTTLQNFSTTGGAGSGAHDRSRCGAA